MAQYKGKAVSKNNAAAYAEIWQTGAQVVALIIDIKTGDVADIVTYARAAPGCSYVCDYSTDVMFSDQVDHFIASALDSYRPVIA